MPEITLQEAFAAHQRGDLAEAERLYRTLLAVRPQDPLCLGNLGRLLADHGRVDEGIAAYQAALRLAPRLASLHYNLGKALRTRGDWAGAAASYRQAIALAPDLALAYNNLGNILLAMGRRQEAIAAYQEGLKRNPADPVTHNNLGNVFKADGRVDHAETSYREALRLAPTFGEACSNLSDMCFLTGRLDEALELGRQARALCPDHALLHSTFMSMMLYHPDYDISRQRQELAAWRRHFADPVKDQIRPLFNDPAPERPLRIGYVSPDFRDHVVGRNMLPLFRHHDRRHYELFCYGDVNLPDAFTEEFRRLSTSFLITSGLTHEELINRIRADRIDILVDLALHMAGSRLPVFACKPAPVQVTFAGHPGSTGLDTIDYRLTDPWLDPPGGDETAYTEKSVRLPSTFWCYDPLDATPPQPGPLPASTNGYITFGCLNNFCKVNEGVLALWAKVLTAVPDSRLVMLADEGVHRQRTLQTLAALGLAPHRARFETKCHRAQYLLLYQHLDIGLDTLPYNGHTTSLDSLFMGVPVITQVGRTVVGRAGVSQLMNLGLPELIAYTDDQFVALARGLAADRPRLTELRATLRDRMRASPLMDAPAFARGIETAYRQMWREWCAATQLTAAPTPVP